MLLLSGAVRLVRIRLHRYARGSIQRAKLIKQIKAPNNDPNDGDICLSLVRVEEERDFNLIFNL